MPTESPPFNDALERFHAYVREKRERMFELVWVFRDDFYYAGGVPVVRWPLPASNRVLARQHYEVGRRRGRGVELAAVFQQGRRIFCCVWSPKTDAEASQLPMLAGLKLSVRDPLPHARLEAQPLLWSIRCLLPAYRRHQEQERFVPERRIAREVNA
jgi:hypothetical protein